MKMKLSCILTRSATIIFSFLIIPLLIFSGCETDPDVIDPEEVGIWKYYSTSNVLNNDYVRAIMQDSEGVIWVGTYGGGVSKYYNGSWTHIRERNGLLDDRIYSIEEDIMGDIWIGTAYGISIVSDAGIDNYETLAGYYFIPYSLFSDSGGWMWIGTTDGIFVFDFNDVYPIHFQDEEFNMIWAITEDNENRVWLGTEGGALYSKDGVNYYAKTTGDGLFSNRVSSVHLDSYGYLWFGHLDADKVTRFDGTDFEHIDLHTGWKTSSITSITEDHHKNIWFTIIESGVAKYDGVISTTYGLNNGLHDDWMACSMVDDEGNIWLGSKSAGLHVYITGDQ